jgi:benzoyl-CoA reductase/2-hydroxyglutaryl-CoA dehydratase subunit BcrC/BadD/HgdB
MEPFMKKDSLQMCINTLEQVRDTYSNRLDTRIMEELDEIIERLKRLIDGGESDVRLGTLGADALRAMNQVLTLVTNLIDLMNR